MTRRLVAIVVAFMMLGLMGEGVAMSVQRQHTQPTATMAEHRMMADCAADTSEHAAHTHKKPCTLADCIAMLTACAAAAAIPKAPMVAPVVYETAQAQRPGLAAPLDGVTTLPAIEPPKA